MRWDKFLSLNQMIKSPEKNKLLNGISVFFFERLKFKSEIPSALITVLSDAEALTNFLFPFTQYFARDLRGAMSARWLHCFRIG